MPKSSYTDSAKNNEEHVPSLKNGKTAPSPASPPTAHPMSVTVATSRAWKLFRLTRVTV